MAYNKTEWKNLPNRETPITAEKLNNIENELEILGVDTGWIDVPLASGISTADWNKLRYRKVGKIVYVNGVANLTTKFWDTEIGIIPYHPTSELDVICRSAGGGAAHVVAFSSSGRLAFLNSINEQEGNPSIFISFSYISEN